MISLGNKKDRASVFYTGPMIDIQFFPITPKIQTLKEEIADV